MNEAVIESSADRRRRDEGGDASDAGAKGTRRRRSLLPRFGLRTLFVLAIVFCLLAAWIGRNVARVRQEEAAIEALMQVDATVRLAVYGETNGFEPKTETFWQELPDHSWTYYAARSIGWGERPQIRSVELYGDDDADAKMIAALDALSVLPEIEKVDLTGSAFDDDAIGRLTSVVALESLSLTDTEVTSAGLAPLSQTAPLRSVYVRHVTTDVVAALPRFRDLRSVSLSAMNVDASDIEGIASLPHLEELTLYDVQHAADPAFYAPLARAANLKSLVVNVFDRDLSDGELEAISELRTLETLSLCRITGGQLATFDLPPSVREIVLRFPITDDAPREFSEAHPDCLVRVQATAWGGPCYCAGELTRP